MDVDSIALGIDFTRAIIEAVSSCDILLVLIGQDWLAITDSLGRRRIDNPDDWVRIEIETALQRDIRVVPVLIDGAVLPRANDLPSGLQPLIRRQALALSHTNFRPEVERLIEAVDKILVWLGRIAQDPNMASRDSGIQQEGWKLELVGEVVKDLSGRATFRLSSGREVHVIAVLINLISTEIEVDGKLAVKSWNIDDKELFLSELSSTIGSDVIIKMKSSFFTNSVKWLTLKIGDQALICVHSQSAVNWCQRTVGSGGSQGFPASAPRMASSAVMPWAAAESR